jgi:hypothetical protein
VQGGQSGNSMLRAKRRHKRTNEGPKTSISFDEAETCDGVSNGNVHEVGG